MSATSVDFVAVDLADVARVARAALLRAGCDEANAAATTDVIVRAERDGCASHGLFRLDGYLAALRSGKANGRAAPVARQIAPGVLRIEAQCGFAPLAMQTAREALAPLARMQGLAAAAIVDALHFSALWADIEALVDEGLGALCCTAYLPVVAPTGAIKPFFGTNPLAFGFPGDEGFIFDFATAATARGEIQIAARDGLLAPEGAGLDAQGRPTRDPAEILGGAQSPFGGHKGSALALMIELLAGVLIGQPTSVEAAREDNGDGGPPRGGLLLLAFDPARFGDAAGWRAHASAYFAQLRALPGIRLPGDRRRAERARISVEGARLPIALWRAALAAAGET
ncbi:MAG: Ldh family oxidoreductase [Hyphomicrobiales bacterium]|nr:Ldh family oxidoreductase [Hyphomicrobiales bacterium]